MSFMSSDSHGGQGFLKKSIYEAKFLNLAYKVMITNKAD